MNHQQKTRRSNLVIIILLGLILLAICLLAFFFVPILADWRILLCVAWPVISVLIVIFGQQRSNKRELHEQSLIEGDLNWEARALALLRQEHTLSAIELVQQHNDLDFEAAKVALYKLEEQAPSIDPARSGLRT